MNVRLFVVLAQIGQCQWLRRTTHTSPHDLFQFITIQHGIAGKIAVYQLLIRYLLDRDAEEDSNVSGGVAIAAVPTEVWML